MRKNFVTGLIFALTFASQAQALSCVRPDVAAAYNFVSASDETFVVLQGKFEFDPGLLPSTTAPAADTQIPAVFKGKLLTQKGFSDDVEGPAVVDLRCFGPWCARITPNTDYLAFVKKIENELIFMVDPCYQFSFSDPTPEMITRVEKCAAGQECEIPKNE